LIILNFTKDPVDFALPLDADGDYGVTASEVADYRCVIGNYKEKEGSVLENKVRLGAYEGLVFLK
jgi:hypothetical protein